METSRSKVVRLSSTLAIPENVLVEILSKLPVQSVLRFLCVSREWHALIKSSYSINRHLVHQSSCSDQSSQPCLISFSCLVGRPEGADDDCKLLQLGFYLHHDEETTILGLPSQSSIGTNQRSGARLWGTRNGLVLCHVLDTNYKENLTSSYTEDNHSNDSINATKIREWSWLLIAWNPATQQFRCVPQPKEEKKPTFDLYSFDFVDDHNISEYKLVRVFAHGTYDPNGNDHEKQAEVSTIEAQVFIRSTNSWRQVKDKLEFPSCCFQSTATTLNGVLYWKAVRKSDECYVLSFSLHEEVFSIIQIPIGIRYFHCYDMTGLV